MTEWFGRCVTASGIGPLTYKQAMTLVKIIAWASAHDDCDVTKDEAKDLCRAIQYTFSTSPKKEEAEG